MWSKFKSVLSFLFQSGPIFARTLFTNGFVEVPCYYCKETLKKGNLYDIIIFSNTKEIRIAHRGCVDGRWHKGKCYVETL